MNVIMRALYDGYWLGKVEVVCCEVFFYQTNRLDGLSSRKREQKSYLVLTLMCGISRLQVRSSTPARVPPVKQLAYKE